MFKATNVDGIYDRDPNMDKKAKLYKTLSYQEALEKHLNVMDQAAFSLCAEQKLPIRVFNFGTKGDLLKAAMGGDVGTIVE